MKNPEWKLYLKSDLVQIPSLSNTTPKLQEQIKTTTAAEI